MRKTLFITLVILLTGIPAFAEKYIDIELAQGGITINDTVIDNDRLEYPFTIYNDITYFPMTWSLSQGLGLDIKWTPATGLEVKRNGNSQPLELDYINSGNENQNYKAMVSDGRITVQGRAIDNSKEQYPLFVFRDITYFPMTWHFMVEEFNANYYWSASDGLIINSNGGNENEHGYKTLPANELETLIQEKFYNQDVYVVSTMDVAMYTASIAKAKTGISLSVLVAKNYYRNENDTLIIDDGTDEFGLYDEMYMSMIKAYIPEIYEIDKPGVYVIEKGTHTIIYVKTNKSDYRYVVNEIYSFLGTETEAVISEAEIREILNRDFHEFNNVKVLSIEDAQGMVDNYFYDAYSYTVASQSVAEYVERYAKEYTGVSLVKWANEIQDFDTRDALIINDGTSEFGLMMDETLNKIIKDYPELYSIRNEGVYEIEKGDQTILYVVTNAVEYKSVIDVLYDGYAMEESSDSYGALDYEAEVRRLIENNPTLGDDGEERAVYFAADPEKGYNYPYVIFLPNNQNKDENKYNKKYVLLEGHNFAKVSNDMNVHIYNALTKGMQSHIATDIQNGLYIPRVMPIFPKFAFENSANRPEFSHNHALDSTVMFIEDNIDDIRSLDIEGTLSRDDFVKMYDIEEQIYAIVLDAQKNLREAGYNIENQIFIAGFSGAGNFSSRYTSIYPEQVKAMYSGGMFIPFIPTREYKGVDMIYQLGAFDHDYLFGNPFDLDAYNRVAKIMYLGGQDRHDALLGNDTFTMQQRELAIGLFGNDVETRWLSCQKAFFEVGGEGQFITNVDQAHRGGDEDLELVLEFFKLNSGSDGPVYIKTSEHQNLIIVNSLDDLE